MDFQHQPSMQAFQLPPSILGVLWQGNANRRVDWSLCWFPVSVSPGPEPPSLPLKAFSLHLIHDTRSLQHFDFNRCNFVPGYSDLQWNWIIVDDNNRRACLVCWLWTDVAESKLEKRWPLKIAKHIQLRGRLLALTGDTNFLSRSHKHSFSEFFCAPETGRALLCVWFGRVTLCHCCCCHSRPEILSCADLQGPAGQPLCHSAVQSAVQQGRRRGKPDLQTSNFEIFRIS